MVTEQQLVIFELNQQQFGLPILQIKEIIRLVYLTPIPLANNYLKGIINLRGQIIPVINLYKRLAFTEKEYSPESRIIVVEYNNYKVGIIVDCVLEVCRYSQHDIESVGNTGYPADCIAGFLKKDGQLVLILNPDIFQT